MDIKLCHTTERGHTRRNIVRIMAFVHQNVKAYMTTCLSHARNLRSHIRNAAPHVVKPMKYRTIRVDRKTRVDRTTRVSRAMQETLEIHAHFNTMIQLTVV